MNDKLFPSITSENASNIIQDIITAYETATDKPLYQGQAEHFILDLIAYRELLMRNAINNAFRQSFPQYATGEHLDWIGDLWGTPRLDNEDDESYRQRILLSSRAYTTCGTAEMYMHHVLNVDAMVLDCFVETKGNGVVDIYTLLDDALDTQAKDALNHRIYAYVSDDTRRTICDTIRVRSAKTITTPVTVTLMIEPGYDFATIKREFKQVLNRYLTTIQRRLNTPFIPEEVIKLAQQTDGVKRSFVTEAFIQPAPNQVMKFSQVTITERET